MAPGLLTATFLQPKEVIAIGTNVRPACALQVLLRASRMR
jgi:hypothetical protein